MQNVAQGYTAMVALATAGDEKAKLTMLCSVFDVSGSGNLVMTQLKALSQVRERLYTCIRVYLQLALISYIRGLLPLPLVWYTPWGGWCLDVIFSPCPLGSE